MRLLLLCLFSFSSAIYAVPCTLSIVKATCWKDYEVTVTAEDALTGKVVATPIVAKGSLYGRASFECQPAQGISMKASYAPVIWDADKGKFYPAVRFWYLPQAAPVPGSTWEIKICFPGQFSSVPSPAGNVVGCKCDMSVLPPLPSH